MRELYQRNFPARFPRVWQTKLLWCVAYSFVSALIAWIMCLTLTGDLKASDIPNLTFWYRIFLIASGFATLWWVFKATQHFRVGVSGYKIASPSLIMLFATICLLWTAPVVFAYISTGALRSTSGPEEAGAAYLRIQRVASLLASNAETHYEPFRLQSPIGSLEPVDQYSSGFIKSNAAAAMQPISVFSPPAIRPVLLNFLDRNVSVCADKWSNKSKAEALADMRDEIGLRAQSAQTETERNSIDKDRAFQSDRVDAEYDKYVRTFRECLTNTMEQEKIDKAEIVQGFKAAEHNAYMVQYAHKAWGQSSGDYRQFTSDPQFAAPELAYVGLGDLAAISVIFWSILVLSIVYLAGEYADSTTMASISRNSALAVTSGFLMLSFFSFASPIAATNNNPTAFDALAAALHWPALVAIAFGMLAILGVLAPTSSKITRSAILVTYLLSPAVITIEILNVVNTFNVDYANGTCPKGSWSLADRLHCSIYAVLQPLVRTASAWIARQFSWVDFQTFAGSRVALCLLLAGPIVWGAALGLLELLKREFVRPRDR